MRHFLRVCILAFFLCSPHFISAQQSIQDSLPAISHAAVPGTPGWCYQNSLLSRSTPNPTPQNGNGTLGNIYYNSACGLDYTQASHKIGQRFFPTGVAQPAPFVIAGIPAGSTIQKAFLWAEGSGNGLAQTATVSGPLGSSNYPMAIVGVGPDKCWSYSGSYTYRADVTASVNGNGTYNISGLLTNPPTSANDMDGATLMVIWSNSSQNYIGTIQIADGAYVIGGGVANYNLTYPAVPCGNISNGSAFCAIGDLQMSGTTVIENGTTATYSWDWWNYIPVATTFTAGQTTSNFNVNAAGDCYNLSIAGIYYRETPTLTISSTPASCSGCNGTASVSVCPAAPVTYSWAPSGGTGATATGLCAGTYTVTVVSNSCITNTMSVVVSNTGGSLTLTQTHTNVLCNGQCNGTTTITASGGVAPYTFSWSPAITNSTVGGTNTATGLCAGTYVVTTTDAGGCTGTQTVTITQPPVLAGTFAQTNLLCNGGGNGTATITMSGGTAPYTFSWSPAVTNSTVGSTNTATSLAANSYVVTATDANGCSITHTFNITQPAAMGSTFSQVNLLCNSATTGSATFTVSGGSSPYTFSWSPAATNSTVGSTNTATGLGANTYVVTATDANGCQTTHTFVITQPSALAGTFTQTNVSCSGSSNGNASITMSGGTAPYTYAWSPAVANSTVGSTNTATGLSAATYVVTVTDANGCTFPHSFVITQPAALSGTFAQTNVACNGGSTGTASITMSGGTAPYTFSWSPAATNSTVGSTNTATGLAANTYVVTVTDANACTLSHTYIITQPPALSSTFSQVDILCNGSNTGTATINMSGGTAPFTFAWSPAATNSTTGSSNTATGLGANTYVVTATDANGCTSAHTFIITQPSALSATFTQTNVLCNGAATGTASITMSGGTAPYTFSWAPSATNSTTGSTNTATGLAATSYVVTATDANGCTFPHTFVITQPTVLTASTSSTNSTCGNANGSATVVPSGGAPTYSVVWSPGGQTTTTATGLLAGPYSVTVTDINLCTYTTSVTVLNTGSPTLAITAFTNVTCNGACDGTATATPSGGTAPYSFTWSPSGSGNPATGLCPGTYTCTVTDANGCTAIATVLITQPPALAATFSQVDVLCNSATTGTATINMSGGTAPYTFSWTPAAANTTTGASNTATGLGASTYVVTATDANGCTFTHSFIITQPTPLAATFAQTDVLCNGGSSGTASITMSGGTSPYTFAWAPAAANSTSGFTNTATGLSATSYVVTATDANGCTFTHSYVITQPTPLGATTSSINSTCGNPNGSATVVPSGGAGGYGVVWSPGGQTTLTATGLLAGPYTVLVTDANLCTFTASVTVNNTGSPTLTIPTFTNVTCNGACDGTATALPAGGTPPYSFAWTPSGGSAITATNLCPGVYTCTVTDANGCIASATVTITEPPALSIASSQVDLLCNAICTGSATVAVSGGTPGYTYSWAPTGGTGPTASALCAGTYTCTVTDANGCTLTQSFNITEPTPLTLASAGFNVSCFGVCDGQVVVIPSGGTPTYSFSWNTGCTTPSCNNICAGNYTVTVTDFNGCVATSTTTVTEPTAVVVTATSVDAHCNLPDGSASSVYSGGTGVLTPVWYNPSSPGANLNGVVAGNYFVVVTDANGCDDTASVTINNIPGVSATINTVTPVSCFGGNNGAASINVSGGTGIITYAWSCSASTTTSAANLIAGNCSVIATDSAGCTSTVNFTVTEPSQLTVSATATPTAICVGQNSTIDALGVGGTAAYSYSWNPGALSGASQTVSPAATQNYSVTVTDANGCMDSTTVTLTVNPNPIALFVGDSLAGCVQHCVNFTDLSSVASGTITGWLWDFGDGDTSTSQLASHCYDNAGNYSVTLTVTTATGCTTTLSMPNYITVYGNPVAEFSAFPQPTTELNPVITFTDLSIAATTWSWSFGDVNGGASILQNPVYDYGGPGCFDVVLTVTTVNGCIDTTLHQVCVDPDVTLFVPNAFTPNNDGQNDFFFPQGVGIDPDHFEMWIFDRWGNMIFYTDDFAKQWDGMVQGHENPCQQDVYVWKIKCSDLLGGKHDMLGHVMLIR